MVQIVDCLREAVLPALGVDTANFASPLSFGRVPWCCTAAGQLSVGMPYILDNSSTMALQA